MEDWLRLEKEVAWDSYHHFSFDFWRTIAFSNPNFKEARAQLIIEASNGKCKQGDVDNAFSHVGTDYNRRMEEEDYLLEPFKLYEKVFDLLEIKNVDVQSFANEIDNVFLENPPLISSGFDTFYKVLIRKNKSISITSNTAFVGGEVITEFLENIPGYEFDFMLYSNIERVAKPNPGIFERMKARAAELNEIDRSNLNFIHIGDNVRTDVEGAELANGDGYLIKDYS